MAYNLSSIMLKAHSVRKATGATMSAALRKAWAAAKIEALNSRLFNLKMKDRWGVEDFETDRRLNNQRRDIAAAAGIELQPEIIKAAPAPVKVKNPALTAEEIAVIENRLFNIALDWRNLGANMVEYQKLQSLLYVQIAPDGRGVA